MFKIDQIVPRNRGEDVNNIPLQPKYVAVDETYGIKKDLNSDIEPYMCHPVMDNKLRVYLMEELLTADHYHL